jgi:MFS family permease
LAVAVLILIVKRVPESRNEADSKKLDFLGATLATLSLGAIVYGLIESSRIGLQSPVVIGTLSAGAILFAAFVLVEARVRHPMMPLSLFRSRNFAGANLLTLFLYASLAGTLYFMPLNLIQVQGYTATAAGAATLPFILIMFLLSRWSGGLVKRYGARLPLVIGPIIGAAGFALFLRPGVGASYITTFLPAIVVLGLGMAISVAPLTTTVMNSVKSDHAGIASGVNNAVSRTAGLLAVAVFGLIMFQAFNSRLDQTVNAIPMPAEARQALNTERLKLAAAEIPPTLPEETRVAVRMAILESFVFGFRRVMLVGAGLALFGSLLAWLAIRSR